MIFSEKFSKSTSFLLAVLMVVNSFLFAIIVSPKPAKAIPVEVTSSVPVQISTAQNNAHAAQKSAFDNAKQAKDVGFQGAATAFDVWVKSQDILTQIGATLVYITVNIILTRLTNDIVSWLNGGAKGSPKITQDFGDKFKEAADLAAGAVVGGLLGLNNNELCDPNFLKVNLKIALNPLEQPTFKERYTCSFTGGIENLKKFKEDFVSGGWEGWISFTQHRANNQLGQLLTAQEDLLNAGDAAIRNTAVQVGASGGFESQEKCVVTKEVPLDTDIAFSNSGDIFKGGSTFGWSYRGKTLEEVMGAYGYNDVNAFKQFLVGQGGAYVCKIITPGQSIAKVAGDLLTQPFKTLNDSLASAAQNLGANAPSILQPYLNAITTAALNLLIKKEKGLVDPKFNFSSSNGSRRQNSSNFKDSSNDLYASKGIAGSIDNFRNQLLQTLLDFSIFAGTLVDITRAKSILHEPPILITNLIHSGYVWTYGFNSGNPDRNIWMPVGSAAGEDPVNAPNSQSIAIRTDVSTAIQNKSANGFPLLPVGGTFNIVGDQCGAFKQEFPTDDTNLAFVRSIHTGFVALSDVYSSSSGSCAVSVPTGNVFIPSTSLYLDSSCKNTVSTLGYFNIGSNKIRIAAFDDNSDGIPDRFVRHILETGAVVTFIDTDQASGADPYIIVGTPPTYPTADYASRDVDPRLYTSELLNVSTSAVPFSGAPSNTVESQTPRVYSSYANTNECPQGVSPSGNPPVCPDNTAGAIYYIKSTVPAVAWNTTPIINWSSSSPDGLRWATPVTLTETIYGLKIEEGGSDGGWCAAGVDGMFWGATDFLSAINGMNLTGSVSLQGWNLGSPGGSSHEFDFGQLSGVSAYGGSSGLYYGWVRNSSTLTEIPAGQVLKSNMWFGDRGSGGTQSCRVYTLSGQVPSIDQMGVTADVAIEDYKIKYYSPTFSDATATITNKRTVVKYNDFTDASGNPQTMQTVRVESENLNPYKMTLSNFYQEIEELTDAFMKKIRVILGYTQGGKKTYLSGLTDQIGSIPDDDPSYTSVSDVLKAYNDLSDLYQTLFSGVSSEETLEGLDPQAEILSPEETNIKFALIGQRCPTTAPTAASNAELINGCGRFGAPVGSTSTTTGQYNMAKRFMFTKDDSNGFTTNPFTGSRSNVNAGLLNLDEMVQQLAASAPDANIIKLIRIRQILEQLQVKQNLKITIYGKTALEDIKLSPDKIATSTVADLIQVNLRNYPEIQDFLNDLTTENKPITDLISAYGFDPANTKEAYPFISSDLDNVLQDVVAQIQEKLKELFLKRVEEKLQDAKEKMVYRLTDFIHFVKDLNPAVQLQVPDDPEFSSIPGVSMKLGPSTGSRIIRIVGSETTNPTSLGLLKPSDCMSLTGEKLPWTTSVCDSPEGKLRGFSVTDWDDFKTTIQINSNMIDSSSSEAQQGQAASYLSIRKALMAGIRQKIKSFYDFMGADTNTLDFQNMMNKYTLIIGANNSIDVDVWDTQISDGLNDVYVLYTGLFNSTRGISSPGLNLTSSPDPITNDVMTTMYNLKQDLSLMQGVFDSISDEYTQQGSSLVLGLKTSLKDLRAKMDTMEKGYAGAYACTDPNRMSSGSGLLGTLVLSGVGYAVGTSSLVAGYAWAAWGGPIGILAGFVIGGFLSSRAKKKAKRKAGQVADACGDAAKNYNNALIDLSNQFICGR